MYNELFSFVTTYIIFFTSSISIPVGEIFSGHFFPSIILSFNASLLFSIAYFNTLLSFPPDAYKNFSSAENLSPYHDFGIIMLSRIFSFFTLISWIDCILCPLLVTAINLLEEDTA